jgi:hypothetical protein
MPQVVCFVHQPSSRCKEDLQHSIMCNSGGAPDVQQGLTSGLIHWAPNSREHLTKARP